MELNEREKTIVNLINNLAEVASDEKSTQEAIDGILSKIRMNSAEELNRTMENAENEPVPQVEFPSENVVNGMHSAIADEKMKMMNDLSNRINEDAENRQNPTLGNLYFTRIREVKAPCKAHVTDAGIDFFVPDAKAWDVDFRNKVIEYSRNSVPSGPNEGVEFVDSSLFVYPHAHVAIPSGIKTIIPQGLAMMMVNKSGVATKLKLDHSACLIDSEYRDELVFCFFNHNSEAVELKPGMKLTQGLLVPVINLDIQEVLNCVYDDMGKSTDRGGGFGSTDQM